MKLALILCVTGAFAYLPEGTEIKNNFLSSTYLRDFAYLLNRMVKNYPQVDALVGGGSNSYPDSRLLLGPRSSADDEQLFPLIMDYDEGAANNLLHPSIRDQEYLQHSSLWGNQYVSGGAGEGKQLLRPEGTIGNRQEVKSDATLPAYCNPPNPCPVGYSGENGCIEEEFENTASFSRRYQASQDCMCDTEHMFDCLSSGGDGMGDGTMVDNVNDLEFNRFLQHTIQMNPSLQHKNLVAKKFHQSVTKKSTDGVNPFLTGERLPVAAKKGNNVLF